jgi:hypothetical protein
MTKWIRKGEPTFQERLIDITYDIFITELIELPEYISDKRIEDELLEEITKKLYKERSIITQQIDIIKNELEQRNKL